MTNAKANDDIDEFFLLRPEELGEIDMGVRGRQVCTHTISPDEGICCARRRRHEAGVIMLSSLRLPALLAICALCSTGGPAPADDIDIPYEKFVLDNGLTLIVHEDQARLRGSSIHRCRWKPAIAKNDDLTIRRQGVFGNRWRLRHLGAKPPAPLREKVPSSSRPI